MTHIRRIRRLAVILTGPIAAAVAALGATPAFAAPGPPEPRPPWGMYVPSAPPPAQVHTIIVGGTPGWQIALIAAAAALAAAAVAVLLERAWAARKAHTTTA